MEETESKNIEESANKSNVDRGKTNIPLPEIPENFIRLTHFTTKEVAQKIIEKEEEFSYEKQSTIFATTDAFSENAQVEDVIKTQRVGAFERGSFGNAVLIIDMDMQEHMKRCRTGGQYLDRSVPNHNILGYVLLENMEELCKNPKYNPVENELKLNLKYGSVHIRDVEGLKIPVETVQGSEDEGIW
ncbi:MAG: hypothetical protein RBS01_02750 [Candidatus Dojkabacteria bacterium]|jgi:hypothetical protein|nr:hypothetical protein [Candidatus Dojkabacteria bacterium]